MKAKLALNVLMCTKYYDPPTLILSLASRAAAISKKERFVITVIGFQPLTIITKHTILDVAAVLDPPLSMESIQFKHLQAV